MTLPGQAPGDGGVSDGRLHYTYVMEKMDLNEVDASCVTLMLRDALGIEAWPTDAEWFTKSIKQPFAA